MAGFFPPSFTPQEEEEEWSWLRGEQRSDLHLTTTSVPTTSGMLNQTQDKLLVETIRSEDKLGVLSLGMFYAQSVQDTLIPTRFSLSDTLSLFSTREPYGADDRLFSPYSEEEAVDEDSLYLALCSRRAKRLAVPSGREREFGTLFLPTAVDENAKTERPWVAFIYDMLGAI